MLHEIDQRDFIVDVLRKIKVFLYLLKRLQQKY